MAVVEQVLIMFILIAVGFVCYKTKLFSEEGTQTIASVVIYIANPATLFMAFLTRAGGQDYSERLAGLGHSFLLSVIALVVSLVVTFALVRERGENKRQAAVEQISLFLTNCGFIGIPLVWGVFGDEGVFYLAAFIAVNNVAVWTLGVVKMKGERIKPTYLLNACKSPAIIGIVLGLIAFLAQLQLPAIPQTAIGYAAGLTTPLAMLTAGATIAKVDLKAMLGKFRLLYISALRLLLIPLLTYAAFLLVPAGDIVRGTNLLAAACPSAAMCVVLAVKYGGDSTYAAEIFAATTLLSMLTLPLVMLLPW
jgi:predicted permease